MKNLAVATIVPVVCRATLSIGLIVIDIDGLWVDDDTVNRILDEADDENDASYASGSVFHPSDENHDDDEESPISPMR
jgi:hypothetical protein